MEIKLQMEGQFLQILKVKQNVIFKFDYYLLIIDISISFKDCHFISNKATNGGAINFKNAPFLKENTVFRKNSAFYGKNNASYPLILRFSELTLNQTNNISEINDAPTGKPLPIKIVIEIQDIYGEKIATLNQGFVYVRLVQANINEKNYFKNLEGLTNQEIVNGTVIFDNLRVFSHPLNSSLELAFFSTLIDEDLDKNKFFVMNDTFENIYPFKVPIKLRDCLPGEIYDSKTASCSDCPLNTYSFSVKDSKCKECLTSTACFGGMNVSINPGFWRANIYSDRILACKPISKSCL